MRTLLLFLCGFTLGLANAAEPPGPPASGPGSATYNFGSITATQVSAGAQGYWLFEPSNPTPASAPYVVFSHGWGGTDPNVYGGWIEHIVRRGNVVIYPIYQDDFRTPPGDFTPNALTAVKAAFADTTPGRVRFDGTHFALVGHSVGGVLTANLAALAAKEGLPVPGVIMSVEPGKTWGAKALQVPLEDLSAIPASALMLTISADRDWVVRDVDAKNIFNGSTAIPTENKNYITLVSDSHGSPALIANHLAPCSQQDITSVSSDEAKGALRQWLGDVRQQRTGGTGLNAYDYYAMWKLFDGLTDAAFFGTNREYALGNTPQQRSMGTWTDGVPVAELQVTTAP